MWVMPLFRCPKRETFRIALRMDWRRLATFAVIEADRLTRSAGYLNRLLKELGGDRGTYSHNSHFDCPQIRAQLSATWGRRQYCTCEDHLRASGTYFTSAD